MSTLKYYDSSSGTWKYLAVGVKGDDGDPGANSSELIANTSSVSGATVSDALDTLDGGLADLQTGIVLKTDISSLSGVETLTLPDDTIISSFAKTYLDDPDASTLRTTLGLGTASTAAEDTLMHLAGIETVTGDKTFNGGLVVGAALTSKPVTKPAGKSLAFSGTSQYVNLTHQLIGTSISWEVTFKLTTNRANAVLLSYGAGTVKVDTSGIYWTPNIFGSAYSHAVALSLNTIYHLIVTQTGTTLNIYLNGVRIVTSATAPAVYNDSPNGNSRIASYNGGSDGIIGVIDEVVIYDKVLSPAEATARYNGGTILPQSAGANITHIFHLDEGSGTYAVNSAGNYTGYGYYGTIVGAATWSPSLINEAETTVQETIYSSADGVSNRESGVHTIGSVNGKTVFQGKSIVFNDSMGLERLRIDQNGNIGVGITNPSKPMDLTSMGITTPLGSKYTSLTIVQNDTVNNPRVLDLSTLASGTLIYGRGTSGALLDLQQSSDSLSTVARFSDKPSSASGDGRVVDITCGRSGGQALRITVASNSTATSLEITNAGTGHGLLVNGTSSRTSGVQYGVAVTPTINQSGAAGYTALLVNPTETTTGSGSKLLIDLQAGSVSRFKVDNTGLTTLRQLIVQDSSVSGQHVSVRNSVGTSFVRLGNSNTDGAPSGFLSVYRGTNLAFEFLATAANGGFLNAQAGIDLANLGVTTLRVQAISTPTKYLVVTQGNESTDATISASSGSVRVGANLTVTGAVSTVKGITRRSSSIVSSANPSVNTDNVDIFVITALAVDIASMTSNLSGTPTEGQELTIAITGTGTRAVTWGASFESSSVSLPASVGTSRTDIKLVWNSASSMWRCVNVS